MINFRFHLASLIAVFLALAIGIVMGSTVVKEATVKGLRAEIRRVERSSDARARQNRELNRQLNDLQDFARASQPYAVRGTLTGVSVAVVAVRGVDGGTAKTTAQLVQAAGASMPGILWLEPSWSLKTTDDARKLGVLLGDPTTSTTSSARLRDEALATLAARLARTTGPTTPVEPAAVTPTSRDMLSELASDGFVTFEAVGTQAGRGFSLSSFPGSAARVLLVDASNASEDMKAIVPGLARALADANVPTAVANVYHQQNKTDRDAGVAGIRDDGTLSKQVSTVDDLDLTEGQTASVLALADLDRRVGHYGYGNGASAPVPPVSPS